MNKVLSSLAAAAMLTSALPMAFADSSASSTSSSASSTSSVTTSSSTSSAASSVSSSSVSTNPCLKVTGDSRIMCMNEARKDLHQEKDFPNRKNSRAGLIENKCKSAANPALCMRKAKLTTDIVKKATKLKDHFSRRSLHMMMEKSSRSAASSSSSSK